MKPLLKSLVEHTYFPVENLPGHRVAEKSAGKRKKVAAGLPSPPRCAASAAPGAAGAGVGTRPQLMSLKARLAAVRSMEVDAERPRKQLAV